MNYLLDTNVCIRFLSGRAPNLITKFSSVPAIDKLRCSIVKAELFYGAHKSQQQKKNLANLKRFFAHFSSLSFDDKSAKSFGKICADLARKGTPIGPYDLQIAAIALANECYVGN